MWLGIDRNLPFFVILPLLVLLGELIARHIPFYRELSAPDARRGRYEMLDGLRGFLALTVLLTHAHVSYFYFRSNTWAEARGA